MNQPGSKTSRKERRKRNRHRAILPTDNTSDSKFGEVFGVAELAEAILMQLPITALPTARLVEKYWKAIVDRSPSLLRKAFLAPRPVSYVAILDHVMEPTEKYRAARHSTIGKTPPEAAFTVLAEPNPLLYRPCNPSALTTYPSWPYSALPQDRRVTMGERAALHPSVVLAWAQDAPLSPHNLPLFNMFLTQPPAKEVFVQVGHWWWGRVRVSSGVRLRDVLNVLHYEVPGGWEWSWREKWQQRSLRALCIEDPKMRGNICINFNGAFDNPRSCLWFASDADIEQLKKSACPTDQSAKKD